MTYTEQRLYRVFEAHRIAENYFADRLGYLDECGAGDLPEAFLRERWLISSARASLAEWHRVRQCGRELAARGP